MYFEGRGVPQSYEDAYAYWVEAEANGAVIARDNIEIAQRQMNLNQINNGQQLAKQMWPKPGN
jgi:TPR repeat protein